MKRIKEDTKRTVEFWLAIVLVFAGLALLFLGFYAVPIGEISATVLTAYGEVSTFAGAILGIDYSYRFKRDKLDADTKLQEDELDERIERFMKRYERQEEDEDAEA